MNGGGAAPAPVDNPRSTPAPSRREVAALIVALLAAVALLPLLGGGALWTRPFWMDEIAMFFLTGESPAQMIRLIERGGDWNPPTLHLLVWGTMRLFGLSAVTPVFLRTFALACVLGALVFVYFILRRRFGRWETAAGLLVLAAQNLVVEHAFEGRFYSPWLLFAAGFAWAIGIDQPRARSLRRDVAVAVFAILLTTNHWYGVFSLGLMCAGVLVAHRSEWRIAARRMAPAAAGVLALVALVPLAMAQRQSAAPVLWVHPLSLAQLEQMSRQFIPPVFIVSIALLLVGNAIARMPDDAIRAERRAALRDPSIAALLSLAAMPLVLIVLSVAITPSMVFRYAIVTTLAWAPLMAMLAHGFTRPMRIALIATLLLMVVSTAAKRISDQRQFVRAVALNTAAFARAKQQPAPVVFQRLHVIYPVAATERGPATLARYMDINDSIVATMYPQPQAASVRASFQLDRDQARYHSSIYGWPVMATVAELDSLPRFYVVATDATLPAGFSPISAYGAKLFPSHRVRRLSTALAVFERDSTRPR